ncbi:phage baseplate assembly protein V [Pseudomonas syringae]|uniref:phage baseplate assembly protein V n=1 Tax=Pseudomonas syringae TaxID=317 RepID=UPI000316C17B|nr:phage baseplate assembly protein V [Pseudomonas syringae]AQL40040.1 phage baseplate protein [Pseudomonas syringae pv. actinidiae ICMP 9853]EPM83610.1 baseplate assembly protein V [Pseudomonas syringae pv. actinidiae ICMP 19068]EPM93822.1 baseplate assembly protein V [Pseudomonas syringae pv. actinidiae ICMP 19104]EPN08338.1 baseplate assembly protein V [Pseudomonas syringae pv. actinidiae ICMP 9855]KCU95250.1 baseplate assembly protein V [Pseudomonas syringae pv. actinidiae ICMP 9617]
MSFALAEHDRMLAGVVKDCYVVALDLSASPPVCRVSDGNWVSAWVRWHSVAAGKARHWRAPSMNEQGTLISASGDVSQGTFIPGLYGNAGSQPDNRDHVEVWRFDDGGSLIYDWQANTYTIDLPSGTVTVTVGASSAVVTDDSISVTSGTITAKAATITLDGNVTISGTLAVVGDIHGGGQIIDTGGNTPNHKH